MNNLFNKRKILFSRIADKYRKTADYKFLSDSTQIGINGVIDNHLLPAFGDKQIGNINSPIIEFFISELSQKSKIGNPQDTLSSATQYNIWLLLQRILRYAVNSGHIDFNPCYFVDRNLVPKPVNLLPPTYSAHDLYTFLDNIFKQDSKMQAGKVKNALITWLVLTTGARCRSLYTYRWDDVNWRKHTIKDNEVDELTIMLLRRHRAFQNAWLSAHPGVCNVDNLIFISNRSSPTIAHAPGSNSYYQWLKKYVERIGLPPINVRSLQRMQEEYHIDLDSNRCHLYGILNTVGPTVLVK